MQFSRSVFEKRAPGSIERIEELSGIQVGQGNWTQDINGELLNALTEAYAEAAS